MQERRLATSQTGISTTGNIFCGGALSRAEEQHLATISARNEARNFLLGSSSYMLREAVERLYALDREKKVEVYQHITQLVDSIQDDRTRGMFLGALERHINNLHRDTDRVMEEEINGFIGIFKATVKEVTSKPPQQQGRLERWLG